MLLNRGISELTRLNLVEAKEAFEHYKALYRREHDIDTKLKHTDFLMEGFANGPESCPEQPAYLCELWSSFEDYVQAVGFEQGHIISDIKSSFFRKAVEAINQCDLAEAPLLSDTIPTGYVYIQAGEYDLAIKVLQSCILKTPRSAAIYGYLGDAYMLRGEPNVARQCYQEAFLIDPAGIDWRYMKDRTLLELREQLVGEEGLDTALALEWVPSYAYIDGLFRPRIMKLNEGVKEFVGEYLELQKAFFKEQASNLKAKLFFRGIILCDNEPLLRFVNKVNFIEVRKQMKSLNLALFSRYLKFIENRK